MKKFQLGKTSGISGDKTTGDPARFVQKMRLNYGFRVTTAKSSYFVREFIISSPQLRIIGIKCQVFFSSAIKIFQKQCSLLILFSRLKCG